MSGWAWSATSEERYTKGMSWIALLIALPVALAGGWYLVNPNAAAQLAKVEGTQANVTRVRLRRANGVIMVLAGVTLYFAISRTLELSADSGRRPGLMLPLAWIALVPFAAGMLILAWLDMRLTRRMKRKFLQDVARSQTRHSAVVVLALVALAVAGCDQNETTGSTPTTPPRSVAMQSPTPNPNPSTSPTTVPQTQPAGEGEQPQNLPKVTMQLGGEAFELQVANSDDERATGLMWVRELGPNEGMIFIFPEMDWLGFWMENTFVPLDLIFVTADGRVLNVEGGVPHNLRSIESAGRAKYVIEIARGRAQQLGVKFRTQLEMPQGIDEGVQ